MRSVYFKGVRYTTTQCWEFMQGLVKPPNWAVKQIQLFEHSYPDALGRMVSARMG